MQQLKSTLKKFMHEIEDGSQTSDCDSEDLHAFKMQTKKV